MAVAGALIGGAIGGFGKKPKIPELPQIDPSQIQQQTVGGNIAALPQAQQLGASVNAFNAAQAQQIFKQALNFLMPGGFDQVSSVLGSQARGELPTDVQQQLLRSGAARSLAGGYAGSTFGRNATLRDLGLTSLDIQQQGLSNLTALAPMASAPQFDITQMFFSPQQRLQFAFQDRDARFQRDLMAAQVKAAPDPKRAALSREIDRFFNTAAQFGMMAGGQAMGGGMGGGGGGGMTMSGPTGGWGYGYNSNWLQQQSMAGSAMGASIG